MKDCIFIQHKAKCSICANIITGDCCVHVVKCSIDSIAIKALLGEENIKYYFLYWYNNSGYKLLKFTGYLDECSLIIDYNIDLKNDFDINSLHINYSPIKYYKDETYYSDITNKIGNTMDLYEIICYNMDMYK